MGFLFFLLHRLARSPSALLLLPLLLPPSSSLTQHRSQQHLSLHLNVTQTTSQISWQAQHFVNLRVQISWQAQHFAACQGVGCTPWRRLGTGAGCADFVAGAALCEPSCADLVAGTALCEPPCADLVAGTALCCLPRGRMYALASAGHRRWMCRFRGRRSTL